MRRVVDTIREAVERSQALFGDRARAIARVRDVASECGVPDWDGYGAEPVDGIAAYRAKAFLRALPAGVPLPEVAPEPDGALSLDWTRSRNTLFSVSVGSSERLAFAWVDGSDRGHGVARFDGEVVPVRILRGIEETMGNGAALGPA